MEKKEFNLLEEPWIRVLKQDCTVEEVSLTDALVHAHEYLDLAGEISTQDIAILRLLLAVLQTVFYRVDQDGEEAALENCSDALERWKTLWDMCRIPQKPVLDYFNTWRERFWLFHPERPFYQVPEAETGTKYGAAKLNGEISESSNKPRLFSSYAKGEKTKLTYSQAARWLVYINSFDDTSGKVKNKEHNTVEKGNKSKTNEKSIGVGWLGKLGLIFAKGKNLAETLLLNLVLLRDGEELWEEPKPCWELEKPRIGERTKIYQPEDAAGLLTLQSRRLFLNRQNDFVVGFSLLGGDFFKEENAFCEQMTIWSKYQKENIVPTCYQPMRHDFSKQFWREFPAAFPDNSEAHTPGVVSWIVLLQAERILDRQRMLYFKIVSVAYDSHQSSAITNTFSDTLAFNSRILTDMEKRWRRMVINEINNCESLAGKVGKLAKDLEVATGTDGQGSAKKAKEEFYYEIDQPFRRWLYSLDMDKSVDEAAEKWRSEAKKIAYALGRRMIEEAGEPALIGRNVVIDQKKDRKTYYCAPKVYNWFLQGVKQVYQ